MLAQELYSINRNSQLSNKNWKRLIRARIWVSKMELRELQVTKPEIKQL